jgi:O-antigen/teichoic acid export membrane protein
LRDRVLRNLFSDTLTYGLSTVLSRGLSILVLPVYTRALSPAHYGALEMVTVAASLAMLFIAMEISQALARFYNERDFHASREVMASTALWFTIFAYGVFLISALSASAPLSEMLLGDGMTMAFQIAATYIVANGVFYLMQNQLRVELRSFAYAALSLFYSVTTITLGFILGYALNYGLNGILAAQCLASTASVFVGFLLLKGSYGARPDLQTLKEMLHFSAPLVPSGLATFFTLQGNRLLLGALIGLEAVGMFGVSTRIASIVSLTTVGLQLSLTPLIYAHYKEEGTPARLARIFEGFAAIASTCCLALGLFAEEVFHLLVDPHYLSAAHYVVILAPATLLTQMYIFFPGIAISRRTHLQLMIFLATGALTLLLNWALIKAFGLAGAVFATLAVSLIFMALWIVVSQKLYPLPIRWRRIYFVCASFVAIAFAGRMLISATDMTQALVIAVKTLISLSFFVLAIRAVFEPHQLHQYILKR